MVALLDDHLGQVGVSGGVDVGNHDLVILQVVGDPEILKLLIPMHELFLLGVEVVVEHCALFGEHRSAGADELIGLLPVFGIAGASEGPDHGEHEELFNLIGQILQVFVGDLSGLGLAVILQETVHDVGQRTDQVVVFGGLDLFHLVS